MRFFEVVGQCVAKISDQLKKIGFKNIETCERREDGIIITTKYDGHGYKTYRVSVELIEEYVGPLKPVINDTSENAGTQQE